MSKEEIFEFENKKLKEVIERINKRIKTAEEKFDEQQHFKIGFTEGLRGTQFNRQALMSMYATEINNLSKIVKNPYFGRFEFKNSESDDISTIYIGKKSIVDNNDIIAYDWRSSICSMYYDYNIGEAEYCSNGKTEKGEIISKRQIIIKNGELERVDEQDTITDDLVLLQYLKENSDARLKSIVATIQSEQNKIIRSPLKKDYIIQGVAGSGKTTVALHRIAYLLYNEAKNITESQFMILGPNKYFLNYISELLPELDINNVDQNTFEEIVLGNIKRKVKVDTKNKTLEDVISGKVDEKIIKYKGTLDYIKLVEKFIDNYIVTKLQNAITYENIELCSAEKLKSIYDKYSYSTGKSYYEKINLFMKKLTKQIKDNSEDLCHSVWLKYREKIISLPMDDPKRKELINQVNIIKNEIKKGCPKQIKEYFNFTKFNCLDIYKEFISNIDQFDNNMPLDVEMFKKYNLDKLSKNNIDSEDLSSLLLICYLVNGVKNQENYEHIVIDEAQDLSLSQYYVLKKMFPTANFDIFGDVDQSIYDYQSISNWDVLNDNIFNSNAEVLKLNKSYRTTKQISNVSNLVLDKLNHQNAECIARNGNNIVLKEVNNNDKIDNLIYQINELLEKEHTSIAIICKDEEETKQIYKKLEKIGLKLNIINEKNEKYTDGISILPSYLSKGLEFDAVILNDANNINYLDNSIDQKLLYVAITRAMHDLYINYSGEISPSLKPLCKEYKNSPKVLVKSK